MHQSFRSALGLMTLLALAAGEARAQYYGGYGGYGGWGGWGGGGSTPLGDFARGAGFYAMGAGQYNLDTAQAASINADTIMRWNQYMFSAQQEANQREYLRRARMLQRDVKSGEAIETRIRENPEDRDIKNGDALNAILHQLTDPKIHSTALRLIRDPIDSKTIRGIPFENASEAVTISLDELTGEGDWPLGLRGPVFAAERKAYIEAIDKAVKEDEEGTLSAADPRRGRTRGRRAAGQARGRTSRPTPCRPLKRPTISRPWSPCPGCSRSPTWTRSSPSSTRSRRRRWAACWPSCTPITCGSRRRRTRRRVTIYREPVSAHGRGP